MATLTASSQTPPMVNTNRGANHQAGSCGGKLNICSIFFHPCSNRVGSERWHGRNAVL